MLEMLGPIATTLGYLILIPALAFVTIGFLGALLTVSLLTLRWLAGERSRSRSRVLMKRELADLKRISKATPDEFSKLFSRAFLSDANRDYLD